MKSIYLFILSILSCSAENAPMLDFSEKLAGDNVFFYKGKSGVLLNGLYIRKKDALNKIYDNKNALFIGQEKKRVEAIKIVKDERNGYLFKSMTFEELKKKNGISVVFSKEFIYFLNFNKSLFGKYKR